MFFNHETKSTMMFEWGGWVIIPWPFNYFSFACTSSILLFTLLHCTHRSLFSLLLPFLSTHCPHCLCWRPFVTKTKRDKQRCRESARVLVKGIREGEVEKWKGKSSSELEQIMFTAYMNVAAPCFPWESRAIFLHTRIAFLCCFSSVSSLNRIVCTFQH